MPTYEYACKACGEHVEVVQSFRDDPLTACPACAGELRKVFGAIGIAFKGSGFYRTDSRPAAKDGSKRAADTKADTGGSTSGDGKADTGGSASGDGKADGKGGAGKADGRGGAGKADAKPATKTDTKAAASS